MMDATLIIGDKNASSWSLRPWLALRHAGIPFREEVIPLGRPDTSERIRKVSPSGRVPVLILGDSAGTKIWDSLSICEWAAERVPSLWPSDPTERAVARSVAAEMHSGFESLRRELPMNIRTRTTRAPSAAARSDIERVFASWRSCRENASHGDFLFGAFSIADCMFAPVVTRFYSYGVELDDVCAHYAAAILAHPAMIAWSTAAELESRER